MRIISWNIRAGGGLRVSEIHQQLTQWQPDIVALSEFRATAPSQRLANLLFADGLLHQLTTTTDERPATNALLLASRFPLQRIWLQTAPQETTRWLLAQIAAPLSFSMGVMHIPNYVSGRKYPFYEAVLAVTNQWSLGPGLLIGDTNSGLPGLDEETSVFGRRETGWFQSLAANGWVDIYRHFKGQARVYTWYSPNGGNGFRIDQAFASQQLVQWVADVRYEWGQSKVDMKRRDALSDHAAMMVDFDFKMSKEHSMSTVQEMFEAVKAGDVGRVNKLLELDPTLLKVRDEAGVSAIMLATYYGQPEVVHALLAQGAELDLFEAAAAGQLERMKALLEVDATLVDSYSPDGFPVLGLAAFFGHQQIIDLLLAHGADPNAVSRNHMQVRPLHSAVAHRQPEVALAMAEALLSHGAAVNVAQHGGWTPLHEAAAHGQVELVKLLLAHGAEINVQNEEGTTPRQMALAKDHHEVAELLRNRLFPAG